jgi:integrase
MITSILLAKSAQGGSVLSRLGDLSPHDLRRTAITRALESGLSYRQVQMMCKHKDPKSVMRYDHGRENLEQSAVNFLGYDEESSQRCWRLLGVRS